MREADFRVLKKLCDESIDLPRGHDRGFLELDGTERLRELVVRKWQSIPTSKPGKYDTPRNLSGALAALFPSVSYDALLSVRRQAYQVHVRKNRKRHEKQAGKYLERWNKGESIVRISMDPDVNYSPYSLCRILLERMFSLQGNSKGKRVTKLIREVIPELRVDDYEYQNERLLNELSEAPADSRTCARIADERLRNEVLQCVEQDKDCSPFIDRIRESVGKEYEYVLQEQLRNRGIPFESEEDLQLKGVSKTPDVRLLVPIGVHSPETGQWHVINWIDSKAMFGDKETHEQDNLQQAQGYVNRFGPGMLIYWFDFVETLNTDSDILVTGCIPRTLTVL